MVDVSRKSWGAHHDEPAEEVAERSLRTADSGRFFLSRHYVGEFRRSVVDLFAKNPFG